MKVCFWINTGFDGANYEECIELDDNSKEEDLDFAMQEYLRDNIAYGYYIEEGED